MKTKREYIESLKKLKLEVYMFGERVENVVDHPIIRPSVDCVAATYELAEKPENREMMTAVSHLTGQRINRFCRIHQGIDDLVHKSKMGRGLGAYTGSCFQRCVGMDALNTLSMITYDIDRKYQTACASCVSLRTSRWGPAPYVTSLNPCTGPGRRRPRKS